MEIQTFLLAVSVEEMYPGNANIPFLMVLRRQNKEIDEPITLRFNLVDVDGRPAGLPRDLIADAVFPKGKKLWKLRGTIRFIFNSPGDYRLDITADEDKIPSMYSYNIEVAEKE